MKKKLLFLIHSKVNVYSNTPVIFSQPPQFLCLSNIEALRCDVYCRMELNPFAPNSPPPENIRKPYGFLMFSGGRERMHWEQMGQKSKREDIYFKERRVFRMNFQNFVIVLIK